MSLTHRPYEPEKTEVARQQQWIDDGVHRAVEDPNLEKYFIVDMFPYPSGQGIHEGHVRNYTGTDVIGRMQERLGKNVLHPMGYDAFGLPAENYAIKNQVHPREAVAACVERFGAQLRRLGFGYDWDREINTTDPEFIKWTQDGFLTLFENGLATEEEAAVNWCPEDQVGLSNEDLDDDGCCERCGSAVEKKLLRQWSVHITKYADDLVDGLDQLEGWEPRILDAQREWIGRKEGYDIGIRVEGSNKEAGSIDGSVFAERLVDVANAQAIIFSPELADKMGLLDLIDEEDRAKVQDYITAHKYKSDQKRRIDSGVLLEGVRVQTMASEESLPAYIAEYVSPSSGNGVLFANPGANKRERKFFEQNGFDIGAGVKDEDQVVPSELQELVDNGTIPKRNTYKLQDWVFSRQRFWGEPIPIIHCNDCGPVAVPRENLPVLLPDVESYEPTGTGESPLADIDDWVNTCCPDCDGPAKRETNTMPQWAGSSWYWLRYQDPRNINELVGTGPNEYWRTVDTYVGGMEHATRHLIYARFWNMVLQESGVVMDREPFESVQHLGLVMDQNGVKISKRLNNGADLDALVEQYGADALRMGVMQMGDFAKNTNWSNSEIESAHKFLQRVWRLQDQVDLDNDSDPTPERALMLNGAIEKVTDRIQRFKFNTAIALIRELVSNLAASGELLSRQEFTTVLSLLQPFAPHLTEEIAVDKGLIDGYFKNHPWPEQYNTDGAVRNREVLVMENGKKIGIISVSSSLEDDSHDGLLVLGQAAEEIKRVNLILQQKDMLRMTISPPGKNIINFVTK